MTRQWLLGDQLGPHFDLGGPFTIIESRGHFARHRFHRQKAHILLSAMRHRVAESEHGTYVRSSTYGEVLGKGEWQSLHPHSRGALALAQKHEVAIVGPSPGFMTTFGEFTDWASGRKRLLLEDWYRRVRKSRGLLMDDGAPVGGQWNFDLDNRQAPPRGRARLLDREPWAPTEDDIDHEVRADLDRWEGEGIRFRGSDSPRVFAVTRTEALAVLEDFVAHRLSAFGPFEDAMMTEDAVLAHSTLSVPMNLGLLSPSEVVERALSEYEMGHVPLASVEGFLRQVLGWREFIWQMYWYQGAEYEQVNALHATEPIPQWFSDARGDLVTMNCVGTVLKRVHDLGWTHHIERLMILSNWALQRGWTPQEVDHWFREMFVDAYPWVMVGNVVGMGLFADGGVIATKPYAAGGSYISKMSNFCGSCRFNPKKRVGEVACPFTAGYWYFLDNNRDVLRGNIRVAPAYRTLGKLTDLDELLVQERARGLGAP